MISFPLGRSATADPLQRFWEKVEPEPNTGCYLWLGPRSRTGYARFKVNGKHVAAYRWIYERMVGPIPPGMEPDHKCRMRCCVNWNHVEPATHQVNSLRSDNPHRKKTHCPNGHPYNRLSFSHHWRRKCTVCNRDAMRRRRARLKAATA